MQFLREILSRANELMDKAPIKTMPLPGGECEGYITGILPPELLAFLRVMMEKQHQNIEGFRKRYLRLKELDAIGDEASKIEALQLAIQEEAEHMQCDLLEIIFWTCVRIYFPEMRLAPHLMICESGEDTVVVMPNPSVPVAPSCTVPDPDPRMISILGNSGGIEELLNQMRKDHRVF